MLDLINGGNSYNKIINAQNRAVKLMVDLVAISNLKLLDSDNLDTKIKSISPSTVTVEGDFSHISDEFIAIGHEIAFISSSSYSAPDTIFTIEREAFGTKRDLALDLTGYPIRTIDVFSINVDDFKINQSKGNEGSPFSYSIDDGSVTLLSNVKHWSDSSLDQKYRLRNKKSAVYIYLGFDKERILMNTMFAYRGYFNSNSISNIENATILFKDKFSLWDDVKIKEQIEFNGAYPKEVFSKLLNYNEDMVYYGNGQQAHELTDFVTTNHFHTIEFETYGEIFSEIILSSCIYVSFDELERVKITSDVKIGNLVASTVVPISNKDINEISLRDDSKNIINAVNGVYKERKALYDFQNDLNGNYLSYSYTTDISSHTLIDVTDNIPTPNVLNVTNIELSKKTDYGDIVILKDISNGMEFHGKTVSYEENNLVKIVPINYDKDYLLFHRGKSDYLIGLGYDLPRDFILYFVRNELPIIYKHQRNLKSGIASSNMNIALLPQVTGQTEVNYLETEAEFGAVSDLETGEFSGLYEEISNIYGTFDNSQLHYNKELKQFSK